MRAAENFVALIFCFGNLQGGYVSDKSDVSEEHTVNHE